MIENPKVLSTRKLNVEQQNMLGASLDFHQYDAISIELLPAEGKIPAGYTPIFTSQNAVRACDVLLRDHAIEACCVGSKTQGLLGEYSVRILAVADKAADLAQILASEYPERHFIHYCGNRRLGELSRILKEHNIEFQEEVVYRTHLKRWSLGQDFDIVLFYSPSGVESFYSSRIGNQNTKDSDGDSALLAICIGPTTAKAAQQYTERIIIAREPTVESVLEALNEHINS
ncbi:uroporphyrinogen-III synthase [Robiginitalea myxolifaciens]|uniref:Uroporphyrinogen-III synthase n=1 Tax=Robiginitalea myxolifaciens TaxID=400055 RepID=A0A1I6G0G7_9FLAO|nr:uroporphyrinogen-III synthase [Robiginitalea myxolifaciens]SFR35651.1 uroporphyrinogen-III synthase [Robiginitalea myxolifaciens]